MREKIFVDKPIHKQLEITLEQRQSISAAGGPKHLSTMPVDRKFLDLANDPLHKEEHKSTDKKSAYFRKEEDFLYGQISGSQMEEFRVLKFSDSGKAQEKLLCIDGFNLFCKDVKIEKTKFSLSSFIPAAILGTRRKERPISSVVAWKRQVGSDCDFVIVFSDPDKPNMYREVRYKTHTPDDCSQIIAKIKFLRQDIQKNTSKQQPLRST